MVVVALLVVPAVELEKALVEHLRNARALIDRASQAG